MDASASLFSKLRSELESYLQPSEIEAIYHSFEIAKEAHEGQKRLTGEPYIIHPVAVARILASMHMDPPSIMAAMLHDVIEDTSVNKAFIAQEVSEEVAELVDGVSKLTQIKFESHAEAQAENFRKMVMAMVRDIRVILIKLADRLHNMRTLSILRPDKRRRIARETLEIYAPIANRLGMHEFRLEFEELGFSGVYPLRHRVLKESLDKLFSSRQNIIDDIKNSIIHSFEQLKLTDCKVKGRTKHLYSIYQKMKRKNLSFSDVTDVFGFRIIVGDQDTCYRVLGAIHNLYKPLPERFKDYIAIPKANGYQALHTTLFGPYGMPIEVQIRTEEMDNMAERGIAAHWLYKSISKEPTGDPQKRARNWLKSLAELQKTTGSSLEFIEDVKVDLFPDEVYVFTPKGDILELTIGASVVDFAYAIHSDIGHTCVAAKIDKRLAPLSTQLSNGQTVEIITAPNARPNPAWLNFVITGKARSKIRHQLNTQRRHESIALGQKLLEKALHVSTLEQIPDKQIKKALTITNHKSLDELLEAIGLGNQMAQVVARRLLPQDQLEALGDIDTHEQPLAIKGTEGMVVNYATCCHPIPGDPILGIFNIGHGLTIHLEACPLIHNVLNQPERYIAVRWEDELQGEFKVEITVETANQRGVLAKLASAIAATDANIDSIVTSEGDGRYKNIHLVLSVNDRAHLANVIRKLRKIKQIHRLSRRRVAQR